MQKVSKEEINDFQSLKVKFVHLNTFMATDEFRNIDEAERSLIDKQVDGMQNYLVALGKRINDKSIYMQQNLAQFEPVDLALPSGLKWANVNVGATLPSETGLYFSFDEANDLNLDGWRVPTSDDFQELCDNCTSEWVTENGVRGRRFTSKINGASVFFPAAGLYDGTSLYYRGSYGYYWSSTWYSATNARYLYFNSSGVSPQSNNYRRFGFSVRAVQ